MSAATDKPTNPTEPLMRGSTFLGLFDALNKHYGQEGTDAVVRALPTETAEACQPGKIYARTWVPERYVSDIVQATFEGPAKQDMEELGRWIYSANELGFGKVQKLLLRLSSPARILSMAASLWGDGHTHGTVETKVEGKSASVVLGNFPPLAHPLIPFAYAEVLRCLIALTGARNAKASHAKTGDTSILINLAWE